MDTLIWNVVALNISNQFSSLISRLFSLFIHLFATTRTVTTVEQQSIVDRELQLRGYCTNVQDHKPGEGLHVIFSMSKLILFHKTARYSNQYNAAWYTYTVYIFGSSAHVKEFDRLIDSEEAGEVNVCYCSQVSLYNSSTMNLREIRLDVPKPWQKTVIDMILNEFKRNRRTSIIISGESGTGKTSIGSILSTELKNLDSPIKSRVYFMDPTSKGFDLFRAIIPAIDDIVILMLDEYDAIVNHAEHELDGDGEGSSMAKSRSSWLCVMDRLAKTRFVIVIATTNVSLDSIDERYIRDGRFDLRYTVE